jgi:hypothetical protein
MRVVALYPFPDLSAQAVTRLLASVTVVVSAASSHSCILLKLLGENTEADVGAAVLKGCVAGKLPCRPHFQPK